MQVKTTRYRTRSISLARESETSGPDIIIELPSVDTIGRKYEKYQAVNFGVTSHLFNFLELMNLQDSPARKRRGIILSEDIFHASTSPADIHSYLETYGQYIISKVAKKVKKRVRIRSSVYFAETRGNHTLFFISWLRSGSYDFEVILGREECPMGLLANNEVEFNTRIRKLISVVHARYLALENKRNGMSMVPIPLPIC